MKCHRKYNLSYNEGLTRKPGIASRARMLGSHVHAGLQAALLTAFEAPDAPADHLVAAAVRAVREYNRDTTVPNQERYDYETRQMVSDAEYYALVTDVYYQALDIVRYQIPRIGLGTRWRVASEREVLFDVGGDNTPMVEWTFQVPYTHDGYVPVISGTVDTVLIDNQTGERVLFDWKTRGIMPDSRLVDLDGQLKLYAAILNLLAEAPVITQTCQYQIRNTVPQPAKLTEKTRKLSMAAIASTWDVWADSVRALGLDPEDYREQMEPKLRSEEDYTMPVYSPVTPAMSDIVIRNTLAIGDAIRHATATQSWPAIPSMTGCQFCEFKSLCRVMDYGGDVAFVLDTEYVQTDPLTLETEVVDE